MLLAAPLNEAFAAWQESGVRSGGCVSMCPNSDGSPHKWDTPHINQPINQGFLVLGWEMESLKPRFEWLPTPVLLGTLPAGVPAPAPASSLQPRPQPRPVLTPIGVPIR